MSARDDYPAGDLMSGWAAVYDRLWTEIDRLRAAAHTTPRCPTCARQCDRTRCDCGPDCDEAEHQETGR